jgi:hypothetical protein
LKFQSEQASASQLRIQAFVAVLLLSTFALTLHIQAARYAQPFSFPTRHILHGDLRPDNHRMARIVRQIRISAVPALAMSLAVVAMAIFLVARPVAATSGGCDLALLSYLARFFRGPPSFSHSIS